MTSISGRDGLKDCQMNFNNISIVVYSDGDPGGCVRLLTSLENTRLDDGSFEVLLVLQGVNEKVRSMLDDYHFSYELRLFPIDEPIGRARARKQGVAEAKNEIILFLDIDLEVSPELLAAHRAAYANEKTAAVMGEVYLPEFVKKSRWFRYLDSDYRSTRRWRRQNSSETSPPLRYVNTANFSIQKNIYEAHAEHSKKWENHEAENIDMAYCIDALEMGDIRYEAEALAFCQHPGLKESLSAKYAFGRFGVPKLLETYPDLYSRLPSRFVKMEGFESVSPLFRVFISLIFTAPVFFIARGLRILGPEFLAFRMMRYMLQYESVRGVKDAVRDMRTERA